MDRRMNDSKQLAAKTHLVQSLASDELSGYRERSLRVFVSMCVPYMLVSSKNA